MERIETTVLRNMFSNEPFFRKVVPYVKPDYFDQHHEKIIYEEVWDFASKYNTPPSAEVIVINLQNRRDLTEDTFTDAVKAVKKFSDEPVEQQWLLDTTEKWCKERAVYLALQESIKIADGGSKELSPDSIPAILQEALSVSFDEHLGLDYFGSIEHRYEFYHRVEDKTPFSIEKANLVTNGGLSKKTLNVWMAPPGIGKSTVMCDHAAFCLSQGYNVLYISLEMAEEKLAERIDAHLLDVASNEIKNLPESVFTGRLNELAKKTQGTLIIKEYPTASAHAGHFEALLNELSLKKSFKPDIIFIDYLNICASSRYRGHIVNSYTYVKSIAEELRGLAVKHNVPVVSATQTTRNGMGNSDPDMADTSESFGLPATADLMLCLISTEELEQSGRIQIKQIKNRYNDTNKFKRFIVGLDRSKMKMYDVEESPDELMEGWLEEDNDTYDKFKDVATKQKRDFSEWL